MARRKVVTANDERVLALYLQGLASTRALEEQIARRAAELERKLMDDAAKLREAMHRETRPFVLRRLEAAYLKCVHRLAMMRRAQALSRYAIAEIDRLLPEGVKGDGRH